MLLLCLFYLLSAVYWLLQFLPLSVSQIYVYCCLVWVGSSVLLAAVQLLACCYWFYLLLSFAVLLYFVCLVWIWLSVLSATLSFSLGHTPCFTTWDSCWLLLTRTNLCLINVQQFLNSDFHICLQTLTTPVTFAKVEVHQKPNSGQWINQSDVTHQITVSDIIHAYGMKYFLD